LGEFPSRERGWSGRIEVESGRFAHKGPKVVGWEGSFLTKLSSYSYQRIDLGGMIRNTALSM